MDQKNTKNFLKDSFIVGVIGLIGKILGWVRDTSLLCFIGTGSLSDAFSLATRLPNCFRKSVAEGAVNNALLPKLKELEKFNQNKRIFALILNIFAIFSGFLFMFYFIEQVFQSYFLLKIAPGFNLNQIFYYSKFVKITSFTSFVYFCYSFFSAILQSRGYFFWPSFSIVILNLSLIVFIKLGFIFGWSNENIAYFYFFATILMMSVSLISCVFYNLYQEKYFYKLSFGFFLIFFSLLFIHLNRIYQILLVILFYCFYIYFSFKHDFFSKLFIADVGSFFLLFLPIFLAAIFTQINDIIAMSFGSLFQAGSMTIIMRSSKVMQIPIAFIMPVFITLFSYLNNLSNDKKNQLHLKKITTLFIFCVTLFFMGICFIFTNYLISAIFLCKISEHDVLLMCPLVKLYSISLPAVLMNRLFQMFFFVEKEVKIPAVISFFNSMLYFFTMKFFIKFNFSLSSIVLPFVVCSWFFFFLNLFLIKKMKLI